MGHEEFSGEGFYRDLKIGETENVPALFSISCLLFAPFRDQNPC